MTTFAADVVQTVAAETDYPTTLTVTADATHRCPFVDEVDHGTVQISWRTCGQTIELHSLARYLADYADVEISHEEFTDCIRVDLEHVTGIEVLSVTSVWTTAGMGVTCSTSPTLADQPS